MIERFDAAFYRQFERFAHWWQRLTGHTSYWLAKWSAATKALCLLCLLSVWWQPELWQPDRLPGLSRIPLFPGIVLFYAVYFGVYWFGVLDEADLVAKTSYQTCRPRFVAQLEPLNYLRPLAIVFVIEAVVDVPGVSIGSVLWFAWVGFFVSIPCFQYWIAVPPLPPGQSKLGELKDRLLAWMRNQVLAPVAAHS